MTSNSNELHTFIETHVAAAEPLYTASALAYWNFTTTGQAEYQQEYQRLETQKRKLYADRAAYAQLKHLAQAAPSDAPLLSRQAKLLLDKFTANQMDETFIEQIVQLETDIEAQFNRFRATLNGRSVSDNQLREVLRNSNSSDECRAAWEASKQIGAQVAEQVRQVVRLRNTAARQIGFPNFYTMALALDELDEEALFQLWDRLDQLTTPLYARYKADLEQYLSERFGVSAAELYPWHYGEPFFQEAPPAEIDLNPYFARQDLVACARQFYTAIGLDVQDVLARSDLYERDGKQQHAYCLHIDRKGDVRILCNLKPTEMWMETLLHELGHAMYDANHDLDLPWVLRTPAHTSTTEAIAIMMGALTKFPAWLVCYAGVPADEAQALEPAVQAQRRAALLVFTRWVLVMSHFERALYRNPDQDLNRLWWDTVEHYQMLRPPPQRPDGDWAAKIHISTAPVYYHNYLLGYLMAAQLRTAIAQDVGDQQAFVASPQVGRWLVERIFGPAARWHWNELMQRATGRELMPDAFVAELHG